MAACAPYTSATAFGGATSYSAATGDLVIGAGKTVTLAAGTYCFHNVTLTGTGALNVGGAVVIVVNGTLTSSGGASFNQTTGRIPGNLQIKSSYTGANGVSLIGRVGVRDRLRSADERHARRRRRSSTAPCSARR